MGQKFSPCMFWVFKKTKLEARGIKACQGMGEVQPLIPNDPKEEQLYCYLKSKLSVFAYRSRVLLIYTQHQNKIFQTMFAISKLESNTALNLLSETT